MTSSPNINLVVGQEFISGPSLSHHRQWVWMVQSLGHWPRPIPSEHERALTSGMHHQEASKRINTGLFQVVQESTSNGASPNLWRATEPMIALRAVCYLHCNNRKERSVNTLSYHDLVAGIGFRKVCLSKKVILLSQLVKQYAVEQVR